MGKMYLMCGLSGAGKTTFAKKFAKENGYTYLSIDKFYEPFYTQDKSVYDKEEISFRVWIKFFEAIHEAEMAGKDVVIDTNAPTLVKRVQFIDWFSKFDEHNLIYIMINDHALQVKNNATRDRVVPPVELLKMRKEFEEPITRIRNHKEFTPQDQKRWNHIYVYENISNHFLQWHDYETLLQ